MSGALPIPSKQFKVLKGHEGPVLCTRFNSNGTYVLTGGQDRSFKLWNPHKGTLIKTYTGHSQGVHGICVSKDNAQILTCGGDKQAFVWDVETGRSLHKFTGHYAQINSIAVNEEHTIAVTGSYDKSVRIWDLKSRNDSISIQVMDDFKDSVTSVCLGKDANEILAASVDGFIRRYDLRKGQLTADCVATPVVSLQLSRDYNCVLAGCLDGVIRLFEKDTGELLSSYKGHDNTKHKIEAMLTNTDGYVVAGSEDGRVVFWDLVEEKMVHTLKGHTGSVCSLGYHPTEQCLVSGSVDGTCRVWK